MVARVKYNMISCHEDLMDNTSRNRIICQGEPTDNAGATAGKPKTMYVGKNKSPISIVHLAEVSDIYVEEESMLLFSNFLGEFHWWRLQCVGSDNACVQ